MADVNLAITEMGLYEIDFEDLEHEPMNFDSGITVLAPRLLASDIAEELCHKAEEGVEVSTTDVVNMVDEALREIMSDMHCYIYDILISNGVKVL